jgi:DNA-binding response OmpR family regulator
LIAVLERSNVYNVMIVDTQIELRHQLVQVLEQAGHCVTAVATISKATSLLEEHVPDLLTTNVVPTDGSGTHLAKQAEAGGAKTLMPDRMIEFDASRQRYLSKPFPTETFLRRVQEILSSG